MITTREVEALQRMARRHWNCNPKRGEEHFRARLTNGQVREIRAIYSKWKAAGDRRGYNSLARIFGCGEATIRDIVKGITRRDA